MSKKTIKLAIISTALTAVMIHSKYPTLGFKDYYKYFKDQKRPAITASSSERNYWESFNKWQCFNKNEVHSYCDKEKGIEYPILTAFAGAKEYYFDLDEIGNRPCKVIIDQWNKLLEVESKVCIYSAKLQNLSPEGNETLWVINRLKTSKGYWIASNLYDDPSEEKMGFDPEED